MTALGAVPKVVDASKSGDVKTVVDTVQQQLKTHQQQQNVDKIDDDDDDEQPNDVQKEKRKRQTNKDRTDPAENE
ncbi:hypothetical protein BLA29_015123, partial [Euroglyphus maynei]